MEQDGFGERFIPYRLSIRIERIFVSGFLFYPFLLFLHTTPIRRIDTPLLRVWGSEYAHTVLQNWFLVDENRNLKMVEGSPSIP